MKLVLFRVKGPTLFAYLSEKTEYTEATAARYTGQLLSALQWLHYRDRAHLDVKPENVLVDQEADIVKVIDLGEAVRAPVDEVVPPADLEFAAPESVLGRPTGPYTDMWAMGVFIYVLLRYFSYVYILRRNIHNIEGSRLIFNLSKCMSLLRVFFFYFLNYF